MISWNIVSGYCVFYHRNLVSWKCSSKLLAFLSRWVISTVSILPIHNDSDFQAGDWHTVDGCEIQYQLIGKYYMPILSMISQYVQVFNIFQPSFWWFLNFLSTWSTWGQSAASSAWRCCCWSQLVWGSHFPGGRRMATRFLKWTLRPWRNSHLDESHCSPSMGIMGSFTWNHP